MKGKTYIGKVLLSVVIAMTMVTTAIPAMVAGGNNSTPPGDLIMPFNDNDNYGDVLPNGYIIFEDDFTTFNTTIWTITNASGDGNFSHNAGGWMDWNQTNLADTENDYLNMTVDLTGLDATCTQAVNLEFAYWGEGGSFEVLADTTSLGTFSPGATPQDANIDLTGYVGTTFTLAFHADSNARNFSIDDVIISANYTVDIAVNFLEDLTNGGYENTFPKVIKANVSNLGGTPASNVDFHLQIYKEQPFEPESYKCWDLESCFLVTWDAISADGDQATWYWTEKRSHSPTHSYACKPDNLPSYDANSEDYLVLHDNFHIPDTLNGKEVHSAYLNFSYWVQGEFDGTNPVDYGYVYISNDSGATWTIIGGPYYDSNGEWVYANIDISAYIGQDIKIRFGWFSDDYMNYEGWYVDDICINLGYTSAQPLVFQGYKYVNFSANETKTIQFPIEFEPEKGTYFIQVYTDIEDCVLTNNEVNYTIIFDDICDAAITDITTSADRYEMPDAGYVNIPIQVTVYNNGTLTEDVPVEVRAQHLLEDVIFEDDMENGDQGWDIMWVAGESEYEEVWTITDTDFFSPTHSWFAAPRSTGIGQAKLWPDVDPFAPVGGLKWQSHIKYNFGPTASAVPVFRAQTYYWDLALYLDPTNYRANPFTGSSGWTLFDADEFIKTHTLYWEYNDFWGGFGQLNSFAELLEKLNERYGPPGFGVEDFSSIDIGFLVEAPSGMSAGEGFWFDDFKLYTVYAGETVWSDTLVAEDLAPGESAVLNFTWNTTEYGKYIITAAVKLDCDQDANNDEMSTNIEIWEQILGEEDADWCDDNTYGGDDYWHIVEECSLCPTNHFWYNGEDTTGNYTTGRNDTLIIDKVFNFTGISEAYFNFTTKYWIEDGWDYGYVEVSNDSGNTWFILDEYTGNTAGAWQDISVHLLPGTTYLTSLSTGMYFIMPANFFTDSMKFRFRFFSDAFTNEKGWYIDDVNITAYNGTAWNTLFFDDMENGDANWVHMYIWYGCHWHEETTFGAPAPTASWYWNGETRNWVGVGTLASYGRGLTDFWNGDWTGTGGWLYCWFCDGDAGFFDGGSAGATGTFSATFDGSSWQAPVSLDLTYWQLNFLAGTPGITANIDVWDGTTSISTPIPNTAAGVNNTLTIDISAMAGSPTVYVSINVTNTAGNDWMGLTSLYINASGPTVPYHLYYNDVDEKLGFELDLTHAYYAVLTFDHNYSFADGDVGWVEISDDNATWQPILYVTGSSDWQHVELDITKYVNHDGPTYVRFRFISDHSGADYGWLVDNVSAWGYVDYVAPTVEATLDPATPDGNFGWYRTPVTVTLTASDNVEVAAIYYSIDGGAYKKYTAPFTIDVDGEHTITYYAVDEVGNPSETGTVSFKLDHTAPTVSINVPQSGYIYFMGRELFANPLGGTIIIGGITFQATASDATSGLDYVSFAVDGMTYEKATSPYEIYWHKFDFLPAKYTLTVSAYDIAGNKASDATIDFTHWL